MNGPELRYSPIEKIYLALMLAIKKLCHYMHVHPIRLISRADPIKYILAQPVLSGRLAKRALLLQEFEITFVPQRAVKGQAIAGFLADCPIPNDWVLSDVLPDEDVFYVSISQNWCRFFVGASRKDGAGAGVVFMSPEGDVAPFSFILSRSCSNNVAEYQALILGLEAAIGMKLYHLRIFGDSLLIINQVLGIYEVRKEELEPYYQYAQVLMGWFLSITLEHVPRMKNQQANGLANLASTLTFPERAIKIEVRKAWIVPALFPFDEDIMNEAL
ncbi:uncharacterized protein [Rutidosis leptorrhynchoides]|uniref:uncharacterized protein n=1 Tax=Rutidosis leptorrhynchoides TaxID=125765 RepID=UPI003A98E20D